MHANLLELEKKLWSAADELRANSELKPADYSVPVLGLIFLRYADVKFAHAQQELEGKGSGRRTIGPTDYKARIATLNISCVHLTNRHSRAGGNPGVHI